MMVELKTLREDKIEVLEGELASAKKAMQEHMAAGRKLMTSLDRIQSALLVLGLYEDMTVGSDDHAEVRVDCPECAGHGRVKLWGDGGGGVVGTAECYECGGDGERVLEEPDQLAQYETAAFKAGML